MARIVAERVTATHEGPVTVFLIGVRVNRLWKLWTWLPVVRAMGPMLRELSADPESGFLGVGHTGLRWRGLVMVQYWESFEKLEAFARARERSHWPAWTAFNRAMATSRGDVGIWHETYVVPAGGVETIYSGMPPTGLARLSGHRPATGPREGARGRLGAQSAVISR